MTKELKYALLIMFAAVLALMFRTPLENVFLDLFNEQYVSKSLAGSTIRLLLIISLLIFMVKKRFLAFNGLHPHSSVTNSFLVVVTVVVILLLSYSSYEIYLEAKSHYLFLFGMEQLFIGFFEELLFRGIIFPLLILHFAGGNRPVLKAAFLSSILFGLIHFIGLIRFPENLWNIINTVLFAMGIGFFLAMLFLRTRNILIPVFIHFLIDFTNGAFELQEGVGGEVSITPSGSTILLTLIVVIFLSLFLTGAGLILYKRFKEGEWLQKVSLIRI